MIVYNIKETTTTKKNGSSIYYKALSNALMKNKDTIKNNVTELNYLKNLNVCDF